MDDQRLRQPVSAVLGCGLAGAVIGAAVAVADAYRRDRPVSELAGKVAARATAGAAAGAALGWTVGARRGVPSSAGEMLAGEMLAVSEELRRRLGPSAA